MVVVFIKSSPGHQVQSRSSSPVQVIKSKMADDLRGNGSLFRKDEVVALHVASPSASIIQ